jgi:hypothetical protein
MLSRISLKKAPLGIWTNRPRHSLVWEAARNCRNRTSNIGVHRNVEVVLALSPKSLNERWHAHAIKRSNQHMIHLSMSMIIVWVGQTVRFALRELVCNHGQTWQSRTKRLNVQIRWTTKKEGKALISFLCCEPSSHDARDPLTG